MATGNNRRQEYSTSRLVTNSAVTSGSWSLTDEEKRAKAILVVAYRYGYINSVVLFPGVNGNSGSGNIMPGQQNVKYQFTDQNVFTLIDTGVAVYLVFIALGIK